MKKEIRVIGIDDSPFNKFVKGKQTLVIATIFRGGSWLDGILSRGVNDVNCVLSCLMIIAAAFTGLVGKLRLLALGQGEGFWLSSLI